jgi:hypothetical protein
MTIPRFITYCFLILLATAPLLATANADDLIYPTPTSQQKPFTLKDFKIRASNGDVVSILSNIELTVTEARTSKEKAIG